MIAELSQVDYQLVDSDASLKAACQIWKKSAMLAVDTEFIRTDTFYPQVGLIQLNDGQTTWLVDPLAIEDWSPFKEIMLAENCTKIFHSCSEDMLVFIAFLGVMPTPMFDTQIAATLLNMGLSISYLNLVKHYHQIELPKDETRSDWLQRPLTQEQLDYAALDVIYLPNIAKTQIADLTEQGKIDWIDEEFNRCHENYASEFNKDFSEYYRSMRAAWQSSGKQLLALKVIAEWREHRARDRNKPRNWILRDQPLYAIVQQLPHSMRVLSEIPGISPNFLRYEGEKVLELIEQVQQAESTNYPSPIARPLSNSQKKTLKVAKEYIESKAIEFQIPPEYLGRKKTIVEFIQLLLTKAKSESSREKLFDELPVELKGWRGEILLDELLNLCV